MISSNNGKSDKIKNLVREYLPHYPTIELNSLIGNTEYSDLTIDE